MHHDWNPLDLNDIVADEFVCPSNAHAEHVSLMASRPVKTVHHGIPIEEYPFKEEKKDYLLFLGRMSPYKGADRGSRDSKGSGRGIDSCWDGRKRGESGIMYLM